MCPGQSCSEACGGDLQCDLTLMDLIDEPQMLALAPCTSFLPGDGFTGSPQFSEDAGNLCSTVPTAGTTCTDEAISIGAQRFCICLGERVTTTTTSFVQPPGGDPFFGLPVTGSQSHRLSCATAKNTFYIIFLLPSQILLGLTTHIQAASRRKHGKMEPFWRCKLSIYIGSMCGLCWALDVCWAYAHLRACAAV